MKLIEILEWKKKEEGQNTEKPRLQRYWPQFLWFRDCRRRRKRRVKGEEKENKEQRAHLPLESLSHSLPSVKLPLSVMPGQ